MINRSHHHMDTIQRPLEKYVPHLHRVRDLDYPGEVATSLEKHDSKKQLSGGANKRQYVYSYSVVSLFFIIARVRSIIHIGIFQTVFFLKKKTARKPFPRAE